MSEVAVSENKKSGKQPGCKEHRRIIWDKIINLQYEFKGDSLLLKVCKFCGEVFRNIEHYKIHINDKCDIRKTRLINGFEATRSFGNNDKISNEIQIHRDLTVASYMDQTLLKHTGAAMQKYTNLLAKERSRTSRMIDKYKFWKKKYKLLKLKLKEKNVNIDEVPVEKVEPFGSSTIGNSNINVDNLDVNINVKKN